MHKRNKFSFEEAVWPPNQAKLVVSVALIHYKGERTQQELFQMVTMHKEGASAIDKLISSASQGPSAKKPRLDYSKVTKNITDIFAADPTDLTETSTSSTKAPKRILIEGAPGIGKTVLAKEIAYQWATDELLTEIKIVFLLYLRDPQLQSIITTNQLFKYMSRGCLDDEQITTFNKYFVNTDGQNLCIVMDGFDEYPDSLKKCSLILNVIKGIDLPEAIVVITSRPTATVSLHDQVDRRIDILGLPKEERDKYISETFSKSPEKKDALDKYLKQQPVINGLCFVPLHLAILLYLFQQGSLPKTLTEMNESFILHTIYRHLERYGPTPFGTVDKLLKLPKQVLDNVHGLSVLAFNGLQENKLVFTSDEIKKTCPHFEETKGAINGYGLLQAVEHFPHEGGAVGRTTSLNFLHYTMQEFLSAFHVTNLPSEQRSSLMNKTFWDGHYNFMWMMFVGIVGIKSDIFVNFASKGRPYKRKKEVRIADTIKNDKRKLLHVFQCYLEAKERTEIPEVISSLFKDGKVIFNKVNLLPHNVTSIMSFICTKESVQWKNLELKQCKIGDIGMSVLQQFISENTSTLEYVDLSDNNSSPWGVYCAIIRHCSVDSLTLCGDHGIEDYVNEIKDILQMNTKLISLTLCNISNNGVIIIAEAIQVNTILQKINVSNNSINDDGATAISKSLKHNTSIIELNMSRNKITHGIQVNKTLKQLDLSVNKISDEGANFICDALKKSNISLQELNISHNNITNKGIKVITEAILMRLTLQNINISKNHISTEGLLYFMEVVKNNCTLQVVNITHNNVTRSGFTSIKQCIENIQHPVQIIASWNQIVSRNGKLLVLSKICIINAFENAFESITEDVWSFEDYDHDFIVTCLSECLKEDNVLLELNISQNSIIRSREKKIVEAIMINKTLQKLNISFTKIHEGLISDFIKINKSLKELNISNNNITSNGAKEIAIAIKVNATLEKLDLSCNMLFDKGATFISDGLTNNISLQELNISNNKITNEGTKEITKAIQINSTLQNINISKNHISTEGLLYFMEAVKNNCTLQVVNITHNNITRSGFTSIKQCIENIQHSVQIIVSWNEINRKGELVTKIPRSCVTDNIEEDVWSVREYDADHFVMCLSDCLKEGYLVQKVDLHNRYSNNSITSEGAIRIAEAIKVNTTLQELDISSNSLSDHGAAAISDALKSNNSLQILKMSWNKITCEGTLQIAEAIKVNKTLQELDMHKNDISDDGAAAISDALKNNNSLQILNMTYNKITSEGATKIAEAIKVNKKLQELHIIGNNVSYDGAAAISDALLSNNSLQILKISSNSITSKGTIKIAEAIKVNKTLQELDISSNSISHYGAAAISDSLKSNNSLQILNMSINKITSKGAIKIAEAIKVSKTLQELDISRNNISDDGAAAISDSLKSNNSLQILDMSINEITSEGVKLIAEAIKVNATLHTLNLRSRITKYIVSFNMSMITALYHNNTLMTLTLPYYVFNDDDRLVRSEVEKLNKERTRQGISTLTCNYGW